MAAGRFSVLSVVAAISVVFLFTLSVTLSCSRTASALPTGIWSDPVQISSTSLFRADVDGGAVYAYGWSNMAVSDDGGSTWYPEMPFGGYMDACDGTLYRADGSDVPAPGTLVFMKSIDDGTTWASPVAIMQASASDAAWGISKFDSTIIVYAFEYAGTSSGLIKSSRSIDDGATWSPPVIVDPNVHCEDPLAPSMVYANGKVYLTYYNYSDDFPAFSDIVVIESPDLGTTWEDRSVVGSGYSPMIAADSGTVYVSFWGDSGLYIVKSLDGDSWTSQARVGDFIQGTDAQVRHSICASSGVVVVAYITYDNPGGMNEYWVHLNYSGDMGTTWEDMGNVTGGNGDEKNPNVMFDGARIHLTWIDTVAGGTFYRSFTFDEPIPEFGAVLLPVISTALLVTGLLLARKR